MKRSFFAAHLFAVLLLSSFGIRISAFAAQPNILLIVADDIGYGDLSCYGGKDFATPQLDALAAGGVRFTSGYVLAPVCGPSRAGLLTGRYPAHTLPYVGNPPHGSEIGVPREHRFLSDHLHDAGYRTAALGKWHLGEQPGYEPQARGFDAFYGFLGGMHDYFKAEDKQWGPIMRGREKGELKDYLTSALADEAAAFLSTKNEAPSPKNQAPWFIYLAFNASHTPLQVPEAYLQKTAHLPDPLRRKNAAMTLALDDAVGRVMKALRESGQEDNTLIIFVSDNGAALIKGSAENGGSNAPLRGSKLQCWEGGIRVPFIMQWKSRLPTGRVMNEPVCTLDVLPTLLAAAKVAIIAPRDEPNAPLAEPADSKPKATQPNEAQGSSRGAMTATMDGLNLLPWLEGQAEFPQREPLCWKMSANNFAIREGDLKYVRVGAESGLFNVRTDPSETNDLAAKRPILAKQLEAKWREWDARSLVQTKIPKPAK